MIAVEEIGIVLMPPVGVVPVVVVVVVAVFVHPGRIHLRPIRMSGIEPLDIVLMPPSRAVPVMIAVVGAPSALSGASVVALSHVVLIVTLIVVAAVIVTLIVVARAAIVVGTVIAILGERWYRYREGEYRTGKCDGISQSFFHRIDPYSRSRVRRERLNAGLLEP